MTSVESTAIFTRSWLLYDLIAEHNDMFHQEIYEGMAWLLNLRDNEIKVPPDQVEEVCAHVRDHDYPEYFSALQVMAATAGLKASRGVNQHRQLHTLLFAPSSLPEI